uniref:Uncharacterized protein n=1 Tax=viral metagenome TaxID=1070528 RepID=A0A6C0I2W3_9ZZZZ
MIIYYILLIILLILSALLIAINLKLYRVNYIKRGGNELTREMSDYYYDLYEVDMIDKNLFYEILLSNNINNANINYYIIDIINSQNETMLHIVKKILLTISNNDLKKLKYCKMQKIKNMTNGDKKKYESNILEIIDKIIEDRHTSDKIIEDRRRHTSDKKYNHYLALTGNFLYVNSLSSNELLDFYESIREKLRGHINEEDYHNNRDIAYMIEDILTLRRTSRRIR